MKLFFDKNEQGDIVVNIQKGTTVEPFNYLLMLHQLMENNTIEEPDFKDFEEEQKSKIKELLNKIHDAVAEGLTTIIDN